MKKRWIWICEVLSQGEVAGAKKIMPSRKNSLIVTGTEPTFGFVEHGTLSQASIHRPLRVLVLYELKYYRSYIV